MVHLNLLVAPTVVEPSSVFSGARIVRPGLLTGLAVASRHRRTGPFLFGAVQALYSAFNLFQAAGLVHALHPLQRRADLNLGGLAELRCIFVNVSTPVLFHCPRQALDHEF
jgi:hypothetical protein